LIIILIDELTRLFPSEETLLARDRTLHLFRNMSVMMPDGFYETPNRGVGLGYFSNLMTIAVRIALDDVYVVKMFNDDILVASDDYIKAVANLEDYFVINQKKTGQEYLKAPYFMNVSMDKKGSVHYQDAQGNMSAIVTSKYHYQRKAIFGMVRYAHKWKLRYHYERIFGFELKRGEVYDHPTMWGLDPNAIKYVGDVTGGLLRKYTYERIVDMTEYRINHLFFPFSEYKRKEFEVARIKAKKYFKNKRWYTLYDEYQHPDLKEVTWINEVNFPGKLTGGYVPQWYDVRSILNEGISYGKFTKELPVHDAMYALHRYSLFRDPIGTYIGGGGVITSPFYKLPTMNSMQLAIYDKLIESKYKSPKRINRAVQIDLELEAKQAKVSEARELYELLLEGMREPYADAQNLEDLDINQVLQGDLDDLNIQYTEPSSEEIPYDEIGLDSIDY
jgi:hypothetical protein